MGLFFKKIEYNWNLWKQIGLLGVSIFKRDYMREIVAKIIFVIVDLLVVLLSLYLAFLVRNSFQGTIPHNIPFSSYAFFYPIYIVTIASFIYEGIYTYRYDFWHESRLILKALLFAMFLVFAYLAMTKLVEHYSRFVIGVSFLFMVFLIPLSKKMIKVFLAHVGIWRKKAKIYGNDPFLREEIYQNPYLGYCEVGEKESCSTLFINSKNRDIDTLKEILTSQIRERDEVIFIPIIDNYDLTLAQIYELSATRTNLIVYENRLKSSYRRFFQSLSNYLLVIAILPILLPIIAIIALAIKIESPGGVFFVHKRVGKGGKTIPTLKFRSMYKDANERLETLLKSDEAIKKEWESSFKIKDDPRVTRVGNFLRKTSLDELPQVFNVLMGHMNFVGPRPVIQEEIDNYYKEEAQYYFMVKPGITGLWQVSGRSDTDYDFRVATDKWYVLNWSLWLDIVILFKTVKVVLKRDGAY